METPGVEAQNEFDVLKKMEDEHLRLQRQVRMTQTDRLHRAMGVHPKFRRQDLLLRTLKKEYLSLHKNLKIARSGAHKNNDKKMKKCLKKSLIRYTRTGQEAEEGLTLMSQIDELLYRENKKILDLHNTVTSYTGKLEERRCLSENRLSSTENKLEAAMCRFNMVQCENIRIREEIEHMLQDRAIFNQAWDRMQSVLMRGKKFLFEVFESTALAYDQRDEWCSKLRSMKEKGRMDQMVQIQEMKDLQKAFDHEMKLYQFLARKGVIRINKIEEERQLAKKEKEEDDYKKEYERYANTINEINDHTQEYNINKIIETFVRREHDNWSLYELLTQYCAENELLRRSLDGIKNNSHDRRDWNDKMEEERQVKIKELREKLAEQKKRTEEKRIRLAETNKIIEDTMNKVNDIFTMLNCSLEPFENLLGDKQPTTRRLNLTFCLITEEIKELVQITYYYERYMQRKPEAHRSRLRRYTVHPEHVRTWSAPSINLLVPAEPCPVCVEARWFSRVCDELERPFTHDQCLSALDELARDPAFVRSDRIHALTDCRVPASRAVLARRYLQ
nr:golgin subfamily A member 6-like protein 22 [Danaus plexippus plexippus]